MQKHIHNHLRIYKYANIQSQMHKTQKGQYIYSAAVRIGSAFRRDSDPEWYTRYRDAAL